MQASLNSAGYAANSAGYCGRFAPSPTGKLHFGSLVAALAGWLQARRQNGSWLIRVDDIDPPREVPGAARAILADLERFALRADKEPLFQSSRMQAYRDALDCLIASGEAFPCWCSRRALEASGGCHRHGRCVSPRNAAVEPAWRLRVPDRIIRFVDHLEGAQQQNLLEDVGDFVLLRADGCFGYHLACAVDDAFQGITEVVRGRDLLDSTPRQIHLQRLLDLPTPQYRHLPLVLDAGGHKLAKSSDAPALADLSPASALTMALRFLGQQVAPNASSPEELLAFALERLEPARMRGADRQPGTVS